MAEELQSLIERINREGVEKANAEAARILESARAQAAATVAEAEEKARRLAETAEAEAKASAERAKETMRQAARDLLIGTGNAVTRLLERVLAKNVDASLSDPSTVAQIAAEAVKNLVEGGEIAANGKLADALRAQLAAQKNITVSLDETSGSGFRVMTDGGRIEHDFTGKAVAAELARRLRADLAELVSEAAQTPNAG